MASRKELYLLCLGAGLVVGQLRSNHACLSGVEVRIQELDGETPLDFEVNVSMNLNPSEFPLGLGILVAMRDGYDLGLWLAGLARALSDYFRLRVLCDGSRYGDWPAPYWSLVWDCGVPFLADDSNSLLVDGTGSPVRVIRRLDLATLRIPAAAELASWIRSSR